MREVFPDQLTNDQLTTDHHTINEYEYKNGYLD